MMSVMRRIVGSFMGTFLKKNVTLSSFNCSAVTTHATTCSSRPENLVQRNLQQYRRRQSSKNKFSSILIPLCSLLHWLRRKVECIYFIFVWQCQMLHTLLRGWRYQFLKITDLPVIQETDHYLVVNKPPDLCINNATKWRRVITLSTMLYIARPQRADYSVYHYFRFCHQLDHATSGLILVAYNSKAAGVASRLFRKRQVDKHYLALVWGHVQQTEPFVVNMPIGHMTYVSQKNDKHLIRKSVPQCNYLCADAKAASTLVVPLIYGQYDGQNATKVLLVPRTGRHHQLRVHMQYLGYPIVGDTHYSDNRCDHLAPRMMLHAYRLHLRKTAKHLQMACDADSISAVSPDPFVTEQDCRWRAATTLIDLTKLEDSNLWYNVSYLQKDSNVASSDSDS